MTSLVFIGWVCLMAGYAGTVTELTDNDFFDYAKDKDVLLVDFYAPWCSDCKALDPDFESAAGTLGRRSIDLAKVDCFGAGKGLCETYGIKSYPTLKNFNRGTYTGDYNGGLKSAEISGYINSVEDSATPALPDMLVSGIPYAAVVPAKKGCTKCKVATSPSINKLECARCKIATPPGAKINAYCTKSVKKQCISAEGKPLNRTLTKEEIDALPPREALKVPYDIADKKRTMLKSLQSNSGKARS